MNISRASTLHQAAHRGGRRGYARRLIEEGLLDEAAVTRAEGQALEQGIALMQYALAEALITPSEAARVAGIEYGLPVMDLDAMRLSALPPAEDYPLGVLQTLKVLPLARHDHRLTVAIPYPSTLTELEELQFATGFSVEGVLAPVDQIEIMLNEYLVQSETSLLEAMDSVDDAVASLNVVQTSEGETASLDEDGQDSDDAPIIKFVNKLLLDAIQRGASDIHFEPYETRYRVRFRIDGILLEVARPPFSMRNRIAARLKIMSQLDISERRLPQDGGMKLQLSRSRSLDFRVNTLPTVYGEKIVLRLLDPAAAQLGIEQLGFSDIQREHYEKTLTRPQGMILVTGPTGSGKTVSLYTGINILNEVGRNICTAEDPVEIKVPGVNQVNVLPRIGLDFAAALRAFLRQDPDVVMVGEVRDLETADIAIKAAQTGHLVLSTVHTNSVAETLTRLANMGVTPFNIASAISLIVSQRLIRKLCQRCREPLEAPRLALEEEGLAVERLTETTLYHAVGCHHCTNGYRGRTGIYEVVPISTALSELIMQGANAIEIDRLIRREGHASLRTSGLARVLDGTTSLAEINRITQE